MTTTLLPQRTARTAFIEEPLRIAIGQPHQVLLSGMSITFTAAFFYDALHKMPFLHPVAAGLVSFAGALGAEYAYLKGLADGAHAKGRSRWEKGLIGTVCILLIVSGTLVTLKYAYPLPALVTPDTGVAVLLTLAHIVPLALLGLCSAMLHAEVEAAHVAERARLEAEARERERKREAEEEEREQRLRARRDEIALEAERRRMEVEAIEAAGLARQRLRAANATPKMPTAQDAAEASAKATMPLACPACGTTLASVGEYGAAKRWGKCKACKE